MRRRVVRASLAALLVSSAIPAAAQDMPQPLAGRRSWALGPYVAVSRHSPVGRLWGLTPDREHVLVGVHATIPLFQGRRWMFAYAPEAIPLIVVTNNPSYRAQPGENGGPPELVEIDRSPVAGAGVAPIGLELQVDASHRVGLYAGGTMGGLWFTRRVPVADARSFNFTFDFGGGVLIGLRGPTRFRAGYKFHHLSNARTAPSNPGVDAHMIFVGVERSFRR
jgi:hypothetical protein